MKKEIIFHDIENHTIEKQIKDYNLNIDHINLQLEELQKNHKIQADHFQLEI